MIHYVEGIKDTNCVMCGESILIRDTSEPFTTDYSLYVDAQRGLGSEVACVMITPDCEVKKEVKIKLVLRHDTPEGVLFIPAEHGAMVNRLAKPGHAIVETLSPHKAEVLHMAVGISGEAGELIDAIKKHVIYGKPLDLENVIEEMGDLEFYMEGMRQYLSLTRTRILAANIEKLVGTNGRYKEGKYTDEAAIDREDKQEEVMVPIFFTHKEGGNWLSWGERKGVTYSQLEEAKLNCIFGAGCGSKITEISNRLVHSLKFKTSEWDCHNGWRFEEKKEEICPHCDGGVCTNRCLK